jgi:c(7)-type cytochrome triheme protein
MKKINFMAALFFIGATLSVGAADIANGKKISDTGCAACHQTGLMGAPKIGDSADWGKRVEKGLAALTDNALNGLNSMPAKGGNPLLKDQEIKDVIAYFLDAAKVKIPSSAAKSPAKPKVVKSTAKPKAAKSVPATATAKKITKNNNLNFNRLMKPPSEWNPAPFEDGIHDPDGEGAYILQAPKDVFPDLDKSSSGNRVDWVKSLNNKKITPRNDRLDPTKKPFIMDLNIVREVKGSMPNVVYPHKQHTQWLDCSNCHPDIFIPKKGANQISMASILMGEKCGVCHGKVAFPVAECRKCHSQNKKKQLVTGNKK